MERASEVPVETDDKSLARHVEDAKVDSTLEAPLLETKYTGESFSTFMTSLWLNRSALGRRAVFKTFWRCIIFCGILNWAALNDGVSDPTLRTPGTDQIQFQQQVIPSIGHSELA